MTFDPLPPTPSDHGSGRRFARHVVGRIGELVAAVEAPGREDATGLLVALSGGPDSVALLLAAEIWARETGRPIVAAHLNHQLRGSDADADEEFCQNLCAKRGIPLHIRRKDPRGLAKRRGRGIEEAGRVLRRRFLDDVLERDPQLRCAATAHHFDDQIETVVMRIFRGTGLDGLRGISPVDGSIIHPMIEVGRRDILAFLEMSGQTWRIDVTNGTGDAVRSRLRQELLPLARDIFGGGATAGAGRLAKLADDEIGLLDDLTGRALAQLRSGEGGTAGLPIQPLLAFGRPLARRVLRAFLAAELGVDRDLELVHLDNLVDWLRDGRSGSSLDLPHSLRAIREFDRLRFERGEPAAPGADEADYRLVVARDGEAAPGPQGGGRPRWSLQCPAARLSGNLQLRRWRAGDRIRVLGMEGHKKISDLLQEKKVPAEQRSGILVVADEEGILWVVGLARAERTRMLPTSEPAVTIHIVVRDANDSGPRQNTASADS